MTHGLYAFDTDPDSEEAKAHRHSFIKRMEHKLETKEALRNARSTS